MTTKAYSLFSVLLLLACSAFGQNKPVDNICICSDYHSLMGNKEYEKLFPPEVMKKQKLSKATVFTIGKKPLNKTDSMSGKTALPLFKEYTEVILLFNADGYIKKRIEYNNGKINCAYDYIRDSINRITQETFTYVDSTGKIMDEYFKTVKDYIYDATGLLEKIKQRNRKGEILSDDRTTTEIFQYDAKRRVTYSRNFIYYDGQEPNSYETKTKFSDKNPTSITAVKHNGKERTLTKTTYNDSLQPVSSVRMDYWSEEKQLDETWTYDATGRVLKYVSVSTNKFSECPEKETYKEDYLYTPEGLLSFIKHSFVLGTCEMRVEYK